MSDDGFWIEAPVLAESECAEIIRAISDRSSSRAGLRHLMSNSTVASVARDQRLLTIAQRAVGAEAVPFRATLFEKSAERNWLIAWHQDTALPMSCKFELAGWGPWSTKMGVHYSHAPSWALSRVIALRLHLDESTEGNGPLRVISGSHGLGVLDDGRVTEYVHAHPQMLCPVPRGGVLAMRPLLIHASSKAVSATPRRVLHIEYADSLDLGPGIRLAVA